MTVAAHIKLGEGTPPAPSAGNGILYFDDSDQQLYVIDAAGATVGPIGGGGGGSGITAANVLYVETAANGGNDATGARGDSTKPFATIAAALSSALDTDVILLGAGYFVGPGTMYLSNPTLKDIAIIGRGPKTTFVTAASGPAFSLVYGAPAPNLVEWEQFVLASMTVRGDGSNPIVIDGTNAPLWFPNPGTDNRNGACFFDLDVTTIIPGGALAFRSCGLLRMERIVERDVADALELVIVNCAEAQIRDVTISNVVDNLDFASPGAPPTGCLGSTYERCTVRDIARVSGQTRSTWIDCTFQLAMRDDKLLVAALQFPQIRMIGGSATSIDFTINQIPDSPFNMLFDFQNVAIGTVAAEVKAPAANRQTILLRGCSVSLLADARAGIDMDARSSTFRGGLPVPFATSGGGAIAPRSFPLPTVALPVGPPPAGALLTFGFDLYSPNGYVAILESDNVAAGNLAAVLKTSTDVTCEASIGAGAGNVTGVVYVR